MYFVNIASPYALAATTSFQKLAPTTTATTLKNFTNATGKLTYTGASGSRILIASNFSVDQATGSTKDINMVIYKNGVAEAGSEIIFETSSGDKRSAEIHWDTTIATDDYFEVYLKMSSAANVNLYNFYVSITGIVS